MRRLLLLALFLLATPVHAGSTPRQVVYQEIAPGVADTTATLSLPVGCTRVDVLVQANSGMSFAITLQYRIGASSWMQAWSASGSSSGSRPVAGCGWDAPLPDNLQYRIIVANTHGSVKLKDVRVGVTYDAPEGW
jgi:hypothetical protein